MDRRRFLQSAGGAGAALWLARCGPAEAEHDDPGGGTAEPVSLEAVGLQLYTVRSLMAEDVDATLADVARIGYDEVEFAGYYERTPAELRATLDAVGLSAPSAHVSLETLRTDPDGTLEAAATLGHRYVVLPWLDEAERGSVDGYRRLAGEMNDFGERCRAAGIQFGYHNHDFELGQIEGATPLDVLIEATDPDLVTFELDIFWLVNGGGDPLDYFARYPGRFQLCHVKDRTAAGDMVDVGAGVIDFASIFRHADAAGLRHYFVEHDQPADPLASIAASYSYLAAL